MTSSLGGYFSSKLFMSLTQLGACSHGHLCRTRFQSTGAWFMDFHMISGGSMATGHWSLSKGHRWDFRSSSLVPMACPSSGSATLDLPSSPAAHTCRRCWNWLTLKSWIWAWVDGSWVGRASPHPPPSLHWAGSSVQPPLHSPNKKTLIV